MTISRWQPRPRPPADDELFTARFAPHLPGKAYRDMHAELCEVARMADPGAETSEALFADHGLVLLVRYHRMTAKGPRWEYVTVEPGAYLCYSRARDMLGTETGEGLEQWFTPVDQPVAAPPLPALP